MAFSYLISLFTPARAVAFLYYFVEIFSRDRIAVIENQSRADDRFRDFAAR